MRADGYRSLRYTLPNRDASLDLELDERARNLVGAEPRLARRARRHSPAGARAAATARPSPARRLDAERGEDVGSARQRRGAELEQRVRPGRERGRDLARHREHLPPLLERQIGRDERAAPLARLDDDGRRAQAGDDAVARRKPPRRGLDSGRVLRDDEPGVRDPACELGVRGRDSRGRCRSRGRRPSSRRLERAAMRLGVDPAGEPADDDEPGGGELPAEAAGNRGAVARARARADDRHGRPRQQLGLRLAAQEEARPADRGSHAAAAGTRARSAAGSGARRQRAARDTRARRNAARRHASARRAAAGSGACRSPTRRLRARAQTLASSSGERYDNASATCSARTESDAASAAIVRATRPTRA